MLIENHAIFARAFELVLEREEGLEVVLARTPAGGRERVGGGTPLDLVVVGLLSPDSVAPGFVDEIKKLRPGLPVAILATRHELETVGAAGTDATISKGAPLADIVPCLKRLVARGSCSSDPGKGSF